MNLPVQSMVIEGGQHRSQSVRDEENPEDGRCDRCDSRCGNAYLGHVDGDYLCEDCLGKKIDDAVQVQEEWLLVVVRCIS
jgi:hypothetical protein